MLKNLLLEEVTVPAEHRDLAWRQDEDGAWLALRITSEGLRALGIKPEDPGDLGTEAPELTEAEEVEELVLQQHALDTETEAEQALAATEAPAAPPARHSLREAATAAVTAWEAQYGVDEALTALKAALGTPGAPRKAREGTKQETVLTLLRREEGATIAQVMEATGWQQVSVRLRQIQIVYDRKGTKRYYGCVHSYASLLHARGDTATFQMVTTPNELKNLDPGSVSRVIITDIPLLKAVPYRGDLLVELGLLSIESEGVDLVAPYLDLLGNMAEKAGVGFVHQALSFAQPIQAGLNLLAGAGKKMELEVGIKSGIDCTGTWVLLRGPEELKAGLGLDAELHPIDARGAQIRDCPYLVFSVEAADSRPDFLGVPEIRDAHAALMEAIKSGALEKAEKDAMPYFRRTCAISPDLIEKHALKLIENQEKRMRAALGTRQVSTAAIQPWSLEEISPFPIRS